MKTNSFAFSSAWGLALVAISALIINTQFLNAPAHAASDPTAPTLDRTIFIEADPERHALGYEGYTLSPRGEGYRLELVGSERHEGTIHIDLDDSTTTVTLEVITSSETTLFEIQVVGDSLAILEVDGVSAAMVVDLDTDTPQFILLAPIAPSAGRNILTNVLLDENFRGTFDGYQPLAFPALAVWGAAMIALHFWCIGQCDCCQAFHATNPPLGTPEPTCCENCYGGLVC